MNNPEFHHKLQEMSKVLHAFAYNLTKNFEDAKDLCQETTYRALHHQGKFQQDSNFKAWVFTIMRNVFINNYRKQRKSNTLLDQSANQSILNSSSYASENQAEGGIMISEINEYVAALDESIRIPFLMHYEGYKYQEISDALDLPLGTIKSRIFFARKELKDKVLATYGFDKA
jgi:RNA polymerase sigma-70 factor (ECF subfamily)